MASVEVATGVFAVDQSIVEGKNGVVAGRRGAVAIDTGNGLEDGQAMVAALAAAGFGPERLVLTHGHGDHVLGGEPFREGEVFAHARCAETMRRMMPGLVARCGCDPERLAWPTVAFAGAMEIELGGRRVQLIEAPGHSPDGIAAYVVEERVLFGGDAVVTGIVPAIQDGDSRVLEATLRRLMALEVEVLVPGHGPVVRGAAHVRDWLAWEAAYLAGVRAAVTEALGAGASDEAAVEAVPFERHVGTRLPVDRHGMPKRHRDTVGKIIRELRNGA